MEALLPSALGPPFVSNLGVVLQVCGLCVMFLSLEGRNKAQQNDLYFSYNIVFGSVAWPIITNIGKFFTFYIPITPLIPKSPFIPFPPHSSLGLDSSIRAFQCFSFLSSSTSFIRTYSFCFASRSVGCFFAFLWIGLPDIQLM